MNQINLKQKQDHLKSKLSMYSLLFHLLRDGKVYLRDLINLETHHDTVMMLKFFIDVIEDELPVVLF